MLDSGVGGLSILAEARKILPQAGFIYCADTAGLPYGEKSEAEIAARVCGLAGRLAERFDPRLICIACNTASTIALSMVRDVLEVPIVGTVPAIKPASALTKSGVIGLLGTAATIRQSYVDRLEAEFAQDKTLLRHAAPDLVSAAEMTLLGESVDEAIFAAAAEGLLSQNGGNNLDIVVLACTHFPLIADRLAPYFPEGTQFVHGAQGIARRIANLTKETNFAPQADSFAIHTGTQEHHKALTRALSGYNLADIRSL